MLSIANFLEWAVQPYALLGIIFVLSGFAFFGTNRTSRRGSRSSTTLFALTAVSILIVGLGVGFVQHIIEDRSSSSTQPPPTEKYSVKSIFRGSRPDELHRFETLSEPIFVDCGQTRPATISWTAPPTAKIVSATSTWIDVANVSAYESRAFLTGPNAASANGSLEGKRKEFLGICLGGGRGRLALSVSYTTPGASVDLATIQSVLTANAPLAFRVPYSKSFPLTAEITVEGKTAGAKLFLTLSKDVSGRESITDSRREGSLPVDARITPYGTLILTSATPRPPP